MNFRFEFLKWPNFHSRQYLIILCLHLRDFFKIILIVKIRYLRQERWQVKDIKIVPTDSPKTMIADLDKQMTIVALIVKLQVLYFRLLYLTVFIIYNFIKTLRLAFSFRRTQTTSAAFLGIAFEVCNDHNR